MFRGRWSHILGVAKEKAQSPNCVWFFECEKIEVWEQEQEHRFLTGCLMDSRSVRY